MSERRVREGGRVEVGSNEGWSDSESFIHLDVTGLGLDKGAKPRARCEEIYV